MESVPVDPTRMDLDGLRSNPTFSELEQQIASALVVSREEGCRSCWGDLPRDTMELIIDEAKKSSPAAFKKFVSSVSLVNRHWHDIVDDHVSELSVKSIWERPLERMLERFSRVHTIKLKGACDEPLGLLAKYPRLTSLNLSDGGEFSLYGMRSISMCSGLKTLKLRGCDCLTDTGVHILSGNVQLETLDMSQCNQIAGLSIMSLTALPNLTSLDLSSCFLLRSQHLDCLSKLTKLEFLDLSATALSDESLMGLKALSGLRTLSLRSCDRISDLGVLGITRLRMLTDLNVAMCPRITDLSVQGLANISSLMFLNLKLCTGITDGSVMYLTRLTNLEGLDIECVPVTSEGLQRLSSLESLRFLDVRGTHGLREGVKFLRREFGLSGVRIFSSC
ncbi:hypothetical protein BSKO_01487 [Bryopsis sp. KO-2023]|nr:hypothetical protein BSKO_01487 [Bryopsis sp. KO-2023]